ncbi:MAG: DUF805 domain-containing protein [Zoogloeaceae bacterium]|jgi:uncharacterized membrane protein YhaH (DUF805 family)|nr:DUF805 domain-containing protein [Zoogloeaceae bacterium]
MDEARYNILFHGMVRVDTTEETVKANLVRLFECDPARIEALFGGQTTVLRRNLDEQEADHYVQVLRETGAIVHKEYDPSARGESRTAPSAKNKSSSRELAERQHEQDSITQEGLPGYLRYLSWPFGVALLLIPIALFGILLSIKFPFLATLGVVGGSIIWIAVVVFYITSIKSPSQKFAARQENVCCELNFISLEGRLGRMRYLGWPLGLALLMIPVIVFGVLLGGKFPLLAPIGSVVVGIMVLAFYFTLTCRRLHDVNLSAWWMLVIALLVAGAFFAPGKLIIPAVIGTVLFNLILYLKAGSKGDNDYGSPPPPNSMGVIILASIVIVLDVIGCVDFWKKDGFTQLQSAISLYSAAKEGNQGKVLQQMDKQIEAQIKNDPELRRRMEEDPEFRQQVEQILEQMRKQRDSGLSED